MYTWIVGGRGPVTEMLAGKNLSKPGMNLLKPKMNLSEPGKKDNYHVIMGTNIPHKTMGVITHLCPRLLNGALDI